MRSFLENLLGILVIAIQIVWFVIITSVRFIIKVFAKFTHDVLKNLYGRIVTLTAILILAGFIGQFLFNQ